jgi:hypothetical protein
VEKYCTGVQATEDNAVNAHWMLDTKGYTHTHILNMKYSDTSANEDNSFRDHIR